MEFKPNGCSGGLSKTWWILKQESCPFEPACDIHDTFYYQNKIRGGGSGLDKKKADCDLLVNIIKCGYPITGILIYLFIRIWTGIAWWLCLFLPFLKPRFRFWIYHKKKPALHFRGNAYTPLYQAELEKQFTKLKGKLKSQETNQGEK